MRWRRAKGTDTARRRLLRTDRVCLAIASALLLLFGSYFGTYFWAQHRIDTHLDDMRAAGHPVTLADMQRPKSSAGAADAFHGALLAIDVVAGPVGSRDANQRRQLRREAVLVTAWRKAGYDLASVSARDLAGAELALRRYAHPLEAIRLAADAEVCQFPYLTGVGRQDGVLLPALNHASIVLSASALVSMEADQIDAAAWDIYSLLSLRRVTHDMRDFFAHSYDRDLATQAARLTAELLPRIHPESPLLARISDELEQAYQPGQFTQMLIVERAKQYEYLDKARRNNRSLVPDWQYLPSPLVAAQIADRLDEFEQMLEDSRRPPQVPTRTEFKHEGMTGWLDYLRMSQQDEVQALTLINAARATIAAERFRRERGRLPRNLDELSPDYIASPPLDPVNGQPLRITATEDGYVVYGLGINGRDDRGNLESEPIGNRSFPCDEGLHVRLR